MQIKKEFTLNIAAGEVGQALADQTCATQAEAINTFFENLKKRCESTYHYEAQLCGIKANLRPTAKIAIALLKELQ